MGNVLTTTLEERENRGDMLTEKERYVCVGLRMEIRESTCTRHKRTEKNQ